MKWNDQVNQAISTHEKQKLEAMHKAQLLESLRSRLGDWFEFLEKTAMIVELLNQENCRDTSWLMLDTLRSTIKEIEELMKEKK